MIQSFHIVSKLSPGRLLYQSFHISEETFPYGTSVHRSFGFVLFCSFGPTGMKDLDQFFPKIVHLSFLVFPTNFLPKRTPAKSAAPPVPPPISFGPHDLVGKRNTCDRRRGGGPSPPLPSPSSGWQEQRGKATRNSNGTTAASSMWLDGSRDNVYLITMSSSTSEISSPSLLDSIPHGIVHLSPFFFLSIEIEI